MGLGEEGRQDVEQELLLQLAHVGVEPPVALAVPLAVAEEHAPRAGLHVLRPPHEPEERAGRVLEPLVGEYDVVDRPPRSSGSAPRSHLFRLAGSSAWSRPAWSSPSQQARVAPLWPPLYQPRRRYYAAWAAYHVRALGN